MTLLALDHVTIATADLKAATAPWQRLGVNISAGTRHAGAGTENAVAMLGDSAERMCYLEFLTVRDRMQAANTARGRRLLAAVDAGGGLFRMVFEAADLDGFARRAAAAGISVEKTDVKRADGSTIGHVMTFAGDSEDDNHPRLIAYRTPRAERYAERRARRLFASDFGLLRVDHLATIPRNMEADTHWWRDVLGAAAHGEVRGGGLYIRQFRVGDAIVEFLGPDGHNPRIAHAKPGLRSMVAFEVADLDAAVALARSRGFNPSDPGNGVLPGTRTATIPPAELGGVALQLLAYVR